uniref:Putative lipocalin-2 1 n=1 Tax=Amblyomma cajennense TaxID=34607 RepID=A0A023FR70_AMBCJ
MQRLSELPLLFLLSLCCLLSNGDEEPREATSNFIMELDIRKAFNTSEVIWLYKQNYNNTFNGTEDGVLKYHTYTCLSDKRISLTEGAYNFTQNVRIDGAEQVFEYYGEFVRNATRTENPPNSLLIYDTGTPDHRHFELMTLVYNSGSYKCMVFFVYSLYQMLTDAEVLCEMYIPENAIKNSPPMDCLKFFNRKCAIPPQKEYQIYFENCTAGAGTEVKPSHENNSVE